MHEDKYKLHRFLAALFSSIPSAEEKLTILENEYGISSEEDIGKEIKTMCNLSLGVLERGWRAGLAEGHAEGLAEGHAEIILNMFRKGFSLEQISDITDKTQTEIASIIKSRKSISEMHSK